MARRPLVALLFGVVISSCSTGHVDTTMPLSRPLPSPTATGPTVATLTVGDTAFSLQDEGGGCLALTIDHPGLQSTVEQRCIDGLNVLDISDGCGWLASDDPPSGCDIDLPTAFYGRIRQPEVGYLCVGTIRSSGGDTEVVSARFIAFDEEGFVLAEARMAESSAAHLFTPDGLRYGQPPLDAPSDPIYRFCEDQAPWDGTP